MRIGDHDDYNDPDARLEAAVKRFNREWLKRHAEGDGPSGSEDPGAGPQPRMFTPELIAELRRIEKRAQWRKKATSATVGLATGALMGVLFWVLFSLMLLASMVIWDAIGGMLGIG